MGTGLRSVNSCRQSGCLAPTSFLLPLGSPLAPLPSAPSTQHPADLRQRPVHIVSTQELPQLDLYRVRQRHACRVNILRWGWLVPGHGCHLPGHVQCVHLRRAGKSNPARQRQCTSPLLPPSNKTQQAGQRHTHLRAPWGRHREFAAPTACAAWLPAGAAPTPGSAVLMCWQLKTWSLSKMGGIGRYGELPAAQAAVSGGSGGSRASAVAVEPRRADPAGATFHQNHCDL